MTNAQARPQKIKKLSLKKATVRDLDVTGPKGAGVRGGQSGSGLHGSSSVNRQASGTV